MTPERANFAPGKRGRVAPERSVFGGLAPACLALVALVAGLTCTAAAPAAAKVRVETHRISPASPFSPEAPCAKDNPGFSPGYAQESSVAVNPRDPRKILVAWIQDGRATDLVMASRNGGARSRGFSSPGSRPAPGAPSRSP